MLEIALMIEGQDGLNWRRWQSLAYLAEDTGIAGLYRSDHYTNSTTPDKDSLELWVSLAWLASHTRRIQFGPLVSPVSFRHPTHTVRMAAAVDDLSGGRLQLGLGAGWQEREHANYGWDLLETGPRFERFTEGLEVITRLLRSDSPVNFSGKFYRLQDAILLPRPQRQGGPPLVIGGNGRRRTLPLAARYADEWNAVYTPPDQFHALNQELDRLLAQEKRPAADVRRSLMTGCVFGRDPGEVARRVEARTHGRRTPGELRTKGPVVGTIEEIRQQLGVLETAGVQRIMLQWLDLDDLESLEALARGLLSD